MPKIYKIMFIFSLLLTVVSLGFFAAYGLNLGVDFKGGSIIEVGFTEGRPSVSEVREVLSATALRDFTLNEAGDNGLIIRAAEVPEDTHQEVLKSLSEKYQIEERRFDSVGPVIGQELKQKSLIAVTAVLLAVIVYIALVFKRIGKSISSWALGLAAIIALLHDIAVPLGVFAILGHWYGVEVSAVFVAAALTILGYSVSDTVVVFDRVRENVLRYGLKDDFGQVVHRSVMQTLTRSLNTTMTTLLALFAIFFFGGESIKYFALALIVGIFSGAYSSIFVASPFIVWRAKGRKV